MERLRILFGDDADRTATFASMSRDCARFQSLCDRDIKLTRADAEADGHCVLWHGPMGSKNLRPPETHTHILDTAKVTSDLRFQAQGKQVSARVYAYMMVHGKNAVSNALQGRTRLRLSSSCKNYRCVNPWHHDFLKKVATSRVAKPTSPPRQKQPKKSTVWSKFTLTENT